MLEFYICSLADIAFLLGLTIIQHLLGRSVTCTFLASPLLQQRYIWDRNFFKSIHVGFPDTQNTCDSIKMYSTLNTVDQHTQTSVIQQN